jgi:putative acetyltransferase
MVTIRAEKYQDINAISHVNNRAFSQKNEAKLINKLRNRGVLTISLVAIENKQIVGHIAFSPVIVESESSNWEAITLAPMAVLPEYQRQGIGSHLVHAGLDECRRLGHMIVVVLGHPNYYPCFGFVSAKEKGVDCEYDVPPEAWMLLELQEGALAGRKGTVRFQPEFRDAM